MITIGADPELFYTQGKGVYPCALAFQTAGIETGRFSTPFGDLYVDGAALELQPNPSTEPEQVTSNLSRLLLWAHSLYTNADLAIVPEMEIDLAWCEEHPDLAVFGCDPDLSAWGEECRPATIDASKHPWRYAGFHIHFGCVEDTTFFAGDVIEDVTKMLDRTVGLASMVISMNNDSKRRGIYGRPGIYRRQPWGMEYRTPSNWLLRSPKFTNFIFELGRSTIAGYIGGSYSLLQKLVPDELLLEVLRSDNIGYAEELYNRIAVACNLEKIPIARKTPWEEW